MPTANLNEVLRRLARGLDAEILGQESDRQLVERALGQRDVAALQAIVHRHGAMVYRVCWRVLRHTQDTEDAFQATFLVVAQKLRTVRKHTSLAAWLYGVAHRISVKARDQAAARHRRESRASSSETMPPDDVTSKELLSVLDTELSHLPDKWQAPLVLCYLEGRTQNEAAKRLGWSKSTLRNRLEEARGALARRLSERGITLTTALSAVLLSDCVASAAPAPELLARAVEAVAHVATGKTLATTTSATVAALAEGAIKAMFITKLKTLAVVLVAAALMATGIGTLSRPALQANSTDQREPVAQPKSVLPPVAKLVEQLGSQEFADREDAEKKLKEVGAKAKPAVLAGLKSENPEIVRRCQAVLNHLRGEEVKSAFLKVAGDDEPARALLAEVLKDSHLVRVLDEAVQHPERSGKLYAAEQWRLWRKAVSTPPGATEADIPTAPEIALSFFLGSNPSSADALKTEPPPNDSRITEGRRAVETDLLCKSLQLELMDPKRRGPFARLMAGWMATRSDPWVVGLGLSQARQYRLPEVVPVARQVVRKATLDAQHRAIAALTLADLGGPVELPTLRGLMDDKTVWTSFREGRDPDGPTFTVELRDVAIGASLLLTDQDPGEFGFPKFRRQGAAELKLHEKLNGVLFAFTSDADRDAAHKKAKEWLDTPEK